MKHKFNYTREDEEISSQLEELLKIDRESIIKGPDLPISGIQTICASIWNVQPSALKGPINRSNTLDREMKDSFLFGCYLYSNKSLEEIAKYFGCRSKTVKSSLHSATYTVKWKWKFADKHLEVFKTLSMMCPGRLDKFEAGLTIKSETKDLKQSDEIISLTEKIREQTIESQSLLIKLLEGDVEALKKKIKILEGKEKEHIWPSPAICFDCAFKKTCKIKELGMVLCPQLMKINNQKFKPGSYWRSEEDCIKKETIKLN